jgi:hypothetical protein
MSLQVRAPRRSASGGAWPGHHCCFVAAALRATDTAGPLPRARRLIEHERDAKSNRERDRTVSGGSTIGLSVDNEPGARRDWVVSDGNPGFAR